jgi:microcystin-dependent protein
MPAIFKNNAASVLAATIQLNATAAQVTNGTGNRFPAPAAGEFFYVTIQAGADWEIVKCTARAGDVLIIERAQDGSQARLWGVGAAIDMRIPSIVLDTFLQDSDASTVGRALLGAADADAARTALGATAVGEAVFVAVDGAAARAAIDAAATANGVPAGSVMAYAGLAAPTGWLLCAGQSLSRTTYAALFAAIQTTYGSVDGNSFTLPDMRGRAAFGKDNMGGTAAARITSAVSGIDGVVLGAAGGDQRVGTHGHTASQAAHNHGVTDPGHVHGGRFVNPSAINWQGGGGAGYGGTNTNSATTGITINNATPAITVDNFSGGAAANIPPAVILNYIIKT